MGNPAVVLNDTVTGNCLGHQLIGPLGVPVPAPPLPFIAQFTLGLCPTVMIGGKPAATLGSSGFNQPPHVGLHASDLFLAPPLQTAQVMVGSATVMFGGQPAAHTGSMVLCCIGTAVPTIIPSAVNVLIGA